MKIANIFWSIFVTVTLVSCSYTDTGNGNSFGIAVNQSISGNLKAEEAEYALSIELEALTQEKLQFSKVTLLKLAIASGIPVTYNKSLLISKRMSGINATFSNDVQKRLPFDRFSNQDKTDKPVLRKTAIDAISIRKERRNLKNEQPNFRSRGTQYLFLKRAGDSIRIQDEAVANTLHLADVDTQFDKSNVSPSDHALKPGYSIVSSLAASLLPVFTLLGTLALILFTLPSLADSKFSSAEQIETVLQIPTMAKIPAGSQQETYHEIHDTSSNISEAYRGLRNSLHFTISDGSTRSIAVTSPGLTDGKTTTCYKLACDFAALGKNVLVIDADLHKPNLHSLFDVPNHVGLSNLLADLRNGQSVMELFQQTDHPNVTIMPAGTGAAPSNSADLLKSEKMALTLHYAAKKYDLIIIDCPPLLNTSEALIVCHLADATLLALSQQHTLRKSAAKAATLLHRAGINSMGSVITHSDDLKLMASYAYRYAANGLSANGVHHDTYLLEGDEPTFDWETHKQILLSSVYGRPAQ